jgi:sigma-E factor negative regulatory protein RseB
MTFTPSKKVLERLQFVDMELLEITEPIAVAAGIVECPDESSISAAWMVQWLPSGFVEVGSETDEVVGDMVMFTDGLSSFSVFVRPSTLAVVPQGQAQRGATVAYMQQSMFGVIPHTVSVVGELPAVVAQRIAASITSKPIVSKPTAHAMPTVQSPPVIDE